MPDIRAIRRQIRGVQNIAKITRAMEMVAASKMKKAQERGLAARPYAERIHQVIADLAALPEADSALHPCLACRPITRMTIIHITPDRGLCGGLVGSLNRSAAGFLLEQEADVNMVCVGRKGVDFMRRYGRDMRAEFTDLGDRPSMLDTLPISRIVLDDYTSGVVDVVYLAYAEFVSTVVQRPVLKVVLPVEPAAIPTQQNVDYIYEPDPAAVLDQLLPRFVEMQVYQAIVEAIASEQSARMVAMRNATDNAKELLQDLTLVYNKARQESITKELLDITGGVAALE